eukprot:CAMPEP_0168428532 /NCGR_PEP_ID=MMETSP0228-20121227/36907_1 /TAXON_ID=133427 /ORGANISM="Protoceratium reticulatum, Strain CCCM 535 (=CCMP 1889)" /LENGTH=38 /DNA_ID= /DNA_START= /DNA_END= /DNA_ORIENTATION=
MAPVDTVRQSRAASPPPRKSLSADSSSKPRSKENVEAN